MTAPPPQRPPPPPSQNRGPPRQDQQRRPKGGRGKNRDRGRIATPWQEGVICQICKKEGHPASDCWWLYGDDDDEDDTHTHQKGAYGVDSNWVMDTGATNHTTGQLNKLQMHETYAGRDQVHNASGQDMEIANI